MKSKLKKLILLPLTALAVATPIMMTSCGSDTNTSTTDTTNGGTDNYSTQEMVDKGTNDQQMSDNQKNTQDNKAKTINSEYERLSQVEDQVELKEAFNTYDSKGLQFDRTYYQTYDDRYNSLISNDLTSEEEFTSFHLVLAQSFKDTSFEYGFVSKSEYEQKYQSSWESFLQQSEIDSYVLLNTSNSNYTYTSFIYHTLYIAIWGDIMIYKYLEKKLDTAGTYTKPEIADWYYGNLQGNLKTEIDLYSTIYSNL